MKRLAPKATYYCTFCKAEGNMKEKAMWRISYNFQNHACDRHKVNLLAIEEKRRLLDSHLSEADYQTWMKL